MKLKEALPPLQGAPLGGVKPALEPSGYDYSTFPENPMAQKVWKKFKSLSGGAKDDVFLKVLTNVVNAQKITVDDLKSFILHWGTGQFSYGTRKGEKSYDGDFGHPARKNK